ncbi:MAG: hypothetical protein Q9181_005414 [Wetmoreana brouardii]
MHLEPWQSWAVVGLVTAGAYVYYSRTGNKRRGRGRAPYVPSFTKRRTSQRRGSSAEASSSGNKTRKKSQPKMIGEFDDDDDAIEASSSFKPSNSSKKAQNRKGGDKKSTQPAQSSAVDVVTHQAIGDAKDDAQEEDIDNREFAKQMSGLKTGSSFTKPEGARNKTNKQSKQAEIPLNSFNALSPDANGTTSSKDFSNASSTTGADADDDLSPVTSPPFGATQTTTSGDVSDMLEKPGKGTSVLRLTGTEETKRQPKPQRVAQEPETKKQRQNRRKNEEKKLAREQAERERRVLLEKQLRTAREAEGRPAKNGVGSTPATSVWTKPPINNAAIPQAPTSISNSPLLDTFEDSGKPVANGHSAQPRTPSVANAKAWHSEVPSEEEQMRILSEMEGSGGWNTVEKGGKKKKQAGTGKENERKMSTASISVSGTDGQSTSTSDDIALQATPSQSQTEDETPKKPKITKDDIDPKVWNRSNIHLHPDYDPQCPYALTGHPEDSDWAVV